MSIPFKVRLYHEYDYDRLCILDVYMHSKSWVVGSGVNSGIGLGVEVQITKISPDDHFQLVKIFNKSNYNKSLNIKYEPNNKITYNQKSPS